MHGPPAPPALTRNPPVLSPDRQPRHFGTLKACCTPQQTARGTIERQAHATRCLPTRERFCSELRPVSLPCASLRAFRPAIQTRQLRRPDKSPSNRRSPSRCYPRPPASALSRAFDARLAARRRSASLTSLSAQMRSAIDRSSAPPNRDPLARPRYVRSSSRLTASCGSRASHQTSRSSTSAARGL